MRVALEDVHHTREATSTAKSIRALSVHEIAQSMKLNTSIKHTQSLNIRLKITNKTIREQLLCCCHTKITWRNVHVLAIDGGRRIRLLT